MPDSGTVADGGSTGDAGTTADAGSADAGCSTANDCPMPSTKCLDATCTAGACGTSNAAAGASCSDNGGTVCDGNGLCVQCLTPMNCPMSGSLCKVNTCDPMVHTCGSMAAPLGTACMDSGGTVCNGQGQCVANHCMDGIVDGDETDVDCGGATCAPCADNSKCMIGKDCQSKICNAMMHCSVPTCMDGVQNGNETDVDCGGGSYLGAPACMDCPDREHCAANTDCANNLCISLTCVSCSDGVKDGNETDVDCGGPQCDAAGKACAPMKGCAVAVDCQTGVCTGNICQYASNGQMCGSGTLCASGFCVGGVCCNNSCAGTCMSCLTALTGAPNGTCANVSAGNMAPTGQCAVSGVCGPTGTCSGMGTCQLAPAGTQCTTPSCMGTTFTPAGTCDGMGGCGVTMPQTCYGSTPLCDTPKGCVQCNVNGDCPGQSCSGNVFTAGSTCSTSNTCVAGMVQTCSGSAPVCNASKGCVQCNVNGDCPGASCNGNVFTFADTCNGSNTCVGGTQVPCAGATPVCNAALGCVQCNVNADCMPPQTCTAAHTCM